MRLCIATAYEESYEAVGELCVATIRRYAQAFGYEYRVNRERLSERPPVWDKIKFVRQLLDEGYDYILWTDADTLFVRFDQDIRGEIEQDKDFYLTILVQRFVDMPGVRLDVDFPSFGFFLIKNTPWSKALLDRLWGMTRYINSHPRDNGALLEVLGYTYYLDRTSRNTFPYEVWRHIKILDSRWNAIKGVPHVPRAADPILIHYPAQAAPQRLFSMQRDYERLVLKKPFETPAQITYAFDQPIDGEGWHQPETGADGLAFRWTGHLASTLFVPLRAGADHLISFRVLYAITMETWQMFALRANRTRIVLRQEPAAVGFQYSGLIPAAAISQGEWTTLQFCVDQLRTPGEFVAETGDTRQLGVAVAHLQITRVPPFRFSKPRQ